MANGAKIGMKAMTIATRIAAAQPDCVVLFTRGPSGANMAVQLKQAGIPPSGKLMGQSGLSSPQLIGIGGAAVEGLIFGSDRMPGGGTPAGRAFATAYPDLPIVQQAVGRIPWGHNIALIERVKNPTERLGYAEQTTINGWSRSMLVH